MSQSPEQENTGVLGRIGSWFSPWRGRSPRTSTEDASPTNEQAPRPEGEQQQQQLPLRGSGEGEQEERQEGEEEEGQDSQADQPGLSRDLFSCTGADASPSTRRDSPLSARGGGSVPAGGGPGEEGRAEQKQEEEEGEEEGESSSAERRNPATGRNAGRLTPLSSSSEQGVVRDSDQAEPSACPPAGRRLHVYLEETSVSQRGGGHSSGQEVTHTRVKKNIQVIPRANRVDSLEDADGAERSERKRTNLSPAVGVKGHYSALVGVSLKSPTETPPSPGLTGEEARVERMGRRNTGRRRSRKTSQGDGSPLENTPLKKQPVNAGSPPSDSKLATSPCPVWAETHLGEQEGGSASKNRADSPNGGRNRLACGAETQNADSAVFATLAAVVDSEGDMDEDQDSHCRVERLTETAESKRRSVKVSHGEVKFFAKKVLVNSELSPEEGNHVDQGFKRTGRNTEDTAEGKLKPELNQRAPELKKVDPRASPAMARIADRICLFEGRTGGDANNAYLCRSADVSPVRKVTDRIALDVNKGLSGLRAQSAERGSARSSSAPPASEKVQTVRERVKNFTEAHKMEVKTTSTQKSAMAGMSQKPSPSATSPASKSTKPAMQGRLASAQKTLAARNKITSKPAGPDTACSEDIPVPKHQVESKTKGLETPKTGGVAAKSGKVDSQTTAKVSHDSVKPSSEGVAQTKTPGRSGSRSKRRKSKDPTSPVSPSSDIKPELLYKEQEVVNSLTPGVAGSNMDSASFTEQDVKTVTSKISTYVDDKPGGQSLSDNSQKAVGEASDPSDKQTDPLLTKDSTEKPQKEKGDSITPSTDKKNNKPGSTTITGKLTEKRVDIPPTHTTVEQGESVKTDNSSDSLPSHPPASQPPFPVDKQSHKNFTESLNKNSEKAVKEIPSGSRQDSPEAGAHMAQIKEDPEAVTELSKPETKLPEPAVQCSGTAVSSPSSLPQIDPTGLSSKQQADKPACTLVTENDKTAKKTDSDMHIKDPPKGGLATQVPEQKTSATKDPPTPDKQLAPSEPQHKSVSVAKREESGVDMLKQGGNTAEEGATLKPSFTVSVGEETPVKAPNEASNPTPDDAGKSFVEHEAPALVRRPGDRQTSVAPVNDPLVRDEQTPSEGSGPGAGKESATVKTVDPDDNNSKDMNVEKSVPSQRQSEDNNKTPPTGQLADGDGEIRPSTLSTSTTTTTVVERPGNGKPDVMEKGLGPIVNGEIHPPREPQAAMGKPASLPSPGGAMEPRSLTETTKQKPAFLQGPALKKLPPYRGTPPQRDAPSSWLDVDQRFPSPKLRGPEPKPKLSTSVSENDLLELEDDFIQNIKRFGAPFSHPPRKHIVRPPQPPFALPAIREDRFEKPFDPDEFQFGLRKKRDMAVDLGTGFLAKLQGAETDGEAKPVRASIVDRSMLIKGMESRSRLFQDAEKVVEEGSVKEQGAEKKEEVKVKSRPSRLEGSCILNSLMNSRAKRAGAAAQPDATPGGEVSPSSPSPVSLTSFSPTTQPASPFPVPTSPTVDRTALANQNPTQGKELSAQPVVSDSVPPIPSFNDIKLPDYLEKYLPKEPAMPALGSGQQQLDSETVAGSKLLASRGAELRLRPGFPLADGGSHAPATAPPTSPLPPVPHPLASPLGVQTTDITVVKRSHRRPGKMVLFEHAQFDGRAYEVFRDVPDATSLKLSPVISVKVARGCWVLYENPGFHGRCIALEEGPVQLANVWAEPGPPGPHPPADPPMVIGSIRQAVWDYSVPHIDLFSEAEGHGRVSSYHDDAVETGSFGIPPTTASIKVHSGVWLLFSDPGFEGELAVLEQGEFPCPESWGFHAPFVGSLRPLKMGGFKVENPNEVKAVVYEQQGFQGGCVQIESDVFTFQDLSDAPDLETNSRKLQSVGSLKILGGLWVGYEQPGFEGRQYVLEEGEYLDWRDWGGGSEHLLSIRPVLTDFTSPRLRMFSRRDFDELGDNMDLLGPMTNTEETGYGLRTQSLHVLGGVWVAFEEAGFFGEQYVLEKGLYGGPEDWGALSPRIASVMPVILDNLGNSVKFKVQLFSEPGFQGSVHVLEDSAPSLPQGFSLGSCRVLAGSWVAFEGQSFSDRMYVLEEGLYPDLRAMGCVGASPSVLSLQTTGFDFSLPSITLFERSGLRGKRVVLTAASVNLQLTGGCRVQSVLVEGGMWVLYESVNCRGAQILLRSGEVPDWRELSGWQRIGSLRPLIQRQVHFHLRSEESGLLMTVTGEPDDVKLMRIQATEDTGGVEQIWFYQEGHLRCKLLEDCSLGPSGSLPMAGGRLGLCPPDPGHPPSLWSVTADGLVRLVSAPDLLLEVKGGPNYDKNQVILNPFDPSKRTQRWSVEIL